MNKSDFPIFQTYPNLVYLDNAATTQKPQQVLDAISEFYTKYNANVHRGIYDLSEMATEKYETARSEVAKFIGAKPSSIIFTAGTTNSINMLTSSIHSLIDKNGKEQTILLSEMEHHSNLVPWQQLASALGYRLEYIRVTDDYLLDLEDLHQKLAQFNVVVVALTHASNTLGTINPIKQISSLIREYSPQTIFCVDGAQAAPHLKLDMQELDVDFYSFSGHKLLGPTGIGVLYGKAELLERLSPPFTGGGMIRKVERQTSSWAPAPEKFEAGTPNVSGAIALAEACRYLSNIGLDEIIKYEEELIEYTINRFEELDKVTVYGPKQNRTGVFSFTIEGVHPHDTAQILNEHHIAVRAGHHCNQVLMRDVLHLPATARASLYLYNDTTDIDKLIDGIKQVITTFA